MSLEQINASIKTLETTLIVVELQRRVLTEEDFVKFTKKMRAELKILKNLITEYVKPS